MNKTILLFYKKEKGLLVFLILLLNVVASAQPVFQWDKTFGGDDYEQLHAIRPLADGNIIIGGNTQSRISGSVTHEMCGDTLVPNFDFWLLKTDIYGNKIWDRRFGGDGMDLMWTVLPMRDGGFLCGGFSTSNASCDKDEDNIGGNGLADWWVVRTDANGEMMWERTYGTDGWEELREFVELPDGNILAMGWGSHGRGGNFDGVVTGQDSLDIRLAKLKPNGDKIWDKVYGGNGYELGLKLTPTPSGDLLIGGQSSSREGTGNKTAKLYGKQGVVKNHDMWVIKINTEGTILWDRTFGGDSNDVLTDIEPTLDGGFLLGGQSNSLASGNKDSGNKGMRDFFLVKIDGDGNKEWDRSYGGSNLDDGFALYVNEEQEILFGGVSRSENSGNSDKSDPPEGGDDFWMLFLEPNGDKIWDVSFGGANNDAMFDMFPVADGGVILGGHSASGISGYKTQPNVGQDDYWIVKTDCKLGLNLGPDTTICEGGQVLLDAEQLTCNDCRYRWSDGDREPARVITPPITKTVSLIISSRSGCEVRDTFTINVNDAPEEIFANITPVRCPTEKTGAIQVLDIEGGTPTYYYSFNKGPWQEYDEFHNLGSGEYHLQVMDANECVIDSLIILEEPADIELYIEGGGIFPLGEQTTLVPVFSEPVDTFFWANTPSLSCLDCMSPTVNTTETETFTLTAFNDENCKFIATSVVAIKKERNIYFPTAFSPNGDGRNDQYMFNLGTGITKVNMFRIYDRWGALLFELKDYIPGESTNGWDGQFNNQNMPNGPYVFICEIEYLDGWIEQKEGHFTLVR